ncbi:hypothetical protein [Luethyella okanaganae]|uniref:Uncharacterized protein n=1 Tax=Luethyella okanaganae TaxID=69372 RepID=A0ABW1VJ36_9MICO
MWAVIRRILDLAWKYGVNAVNAVVAWVQRNWVTVERWLRTLTIEQIIERILNILGL